jgi:hypothetical protein
MGIELRIDVVDERADAEEADDLATSLRMDLLELDVDSVSPVLAGPAPSGSKGLELVAVGALLVRLKESVPLVRSVVTTVREWMARGGSPHRSLKITMDGRVLELSAATQEQQERLVDEFLRRLEADDPKETA